MSEIAVFRALDNPLPATRSKKREHSLPNYAVPFHTEPTIPWYPDFASATTDTSLTIMGLAAAKRFGLSARRRSTQKMTVWLINLNDDDVYGPLELSVRVSEDVPPEYFQLGWSFLSKHFEMHAKPNSDGVKVLRALDRALCAKGE